MRALLVSTILASLTAHAGGLDIGGLKRIGAGGDATTGDVTTNPTYATQATLSLFVDDALGNDSNACTASGADACKTIQGARAKVPNNIYDAVTITVAAGNYGGFNLEDITLSQRPAGGSAGSLTIVGTPIAASITGLQTGTVASATAGSSTTSGGADPTTTSWGTMTVTGAGWVSGALRGAFVGIVSGTGAGQFRAIADNNATQLSIPGTWTPPTGATFEIMVPGTIINAVGSSGSAQTSVFVRANISGQNSGGIVLDKLRFETVSGGIFVSSSYGRLLVTRCSFAGSAIAVNIQSAGTFLVEDSIATAGTAFIQGTGSPGVTASRNVISGVTTAMLGGGSTASTAHTPASLSTSANYIRGATTGIRWGGVVRSVGDLIDAVTPGTSRGFQCTPQTSGPTSCQYNVRSGQISNTFIAIEALGAGSNIWVGESGGVQSGSGNTTAYLATKGAKIQIRSDATLTGTTEISLDGTSYTLANMRAPAAGLRAITDLTFGTSVYE